MRFSLGLLLGLGAVSVTAWPALAADTLLAGPDCADARCVQAPAPAAVAPATQPAPAAAATEAAESTASASVTIRVEEPAALSEVSRQFKLTRPLALWFVDGDVVIEGQDDFVRRHQLFLQLLEGYFFYNDRLSGMSRQEIEDIFGNGTPAPCAGRSDRYIWEAGPDLLVVEFRQNRAALVAYVQGD